jgi:hypothetical protein
MSRVLRRGFDFKENESSCSDQKVEISKLKVVIEQLPGIIIVQGLIAFMWALHIEMYIYLMRVDKLQS